MNKKILALLMTMIFFSAVVTSCQNDEPALAERQSKAALTGEELFKSVMFGSGEFATRVPTLAEIHKKNAGLTLDQKKEFDERVSNLIGSIKDENPDFFNDFKSKIVSGSHLQIKKAMEESSYEIADRLEILVPGFNELKPVIEQDIRDGKFITDNRLDDSKVKRQAAEYENLLKNNFITSENGRAQVPCSWAVVCVAYFAVAVHNTAAVTANVAVALAVWKWVCITSASALEADTALQMEMLIDDIAQAQ